MKTKESARVGIVMGSRSDLPVMQGAADSLKEFGVPYEITVVSAHRSPQRMMEYAQQAAGRGIQVIIAGACGAAHLPGMIASATPPARDWGSGQKQQFHGRMGFRLKYFANA